MILKQRFADGRTAYANIGEQWLYIQPAATEFKDMAKEYFRSPELEKDCIGLIQYGERKIEPIYKDFPQWIYSNDGQLFMTLTIPEIQTNTPEKRFDLQEYIDSLFTEHEKKLWKKKVPNDEYRNPTRFELQAILHKMNFYKLESGFIAPVWGGELVFFETDPKYRSRSITKNKVLKLIDES